jgi:MoxR-like ATPase
MVAKHIPAVMLTSNNTRELSEALKRRCLYLFINYPSVETELKIVRTRAPELAPQLAKQAVELVQRLRKLDLKKSPSVSETIDWARALVTLNAQALDKETLENTMTVLLKHEQDVQRAKRAINSPGSGRADDGDIDYRAIGRPRRDR